VAKRHKGEVVNGRGESSEHSIGPSKMPHVLERGNIYFIYRPRVEETSTAAIEDVQRFFVILSPHGQERHRLIVIGRK
jgi:hypothetical protein